MVSHLHNLLALVEPSPLAWIVILVVALLAFGSRLPSVAKNMGKSVSEFKKGIREGEEEAAKPTTETKPVDKP
jgi:sec-independent protein translocase protein TatA